MPLYSGSNGKQGFVSIQGDPFKEDLESLLKFARFNRKAGKNILAKIPVTEEGLEAIEILVSERIPVNATEVMAVKQALDVCEIYTKTAMKIEDPAPIYFSVITGIYDEYLEKNVKENEIDNEIVEQTEIHVKYSGYIEKEKNSADKLQRLENIKIPDGFDFQKIHSISFAAREKLTKIQPTSISQESRISGVSPSDVSVLLVYMGR